MTLTTPAALAGLPLLAYLLGSIPWGMIVAPWFTGKDIRRQGSGNIGATNVRRVAGSKAGALVLAGDLLKGTLPMVLAGQMVHPSTVWGQAYLSLVAVAAVIGHCYPLYLGFKGGGKGVATALGCFLVVSPVASLVAMLVFVLMLCVTSRVSAGSLSAAAVMPLAMWKATHSWMLTACALIISAVVALRHKDNIHRLVGGTEPAAWKK